jgi:hypothetical protein
MTQEGRTLIYGLPGVRSTSHGRELSRLRDGEDGRQ